MTDKRVPWGSDQDQGIASQRLTVQGWTVDWPLDDPKVNRPIEEHLLDRSDIVDYQVKVDLGMRSVKLGEDGRQGITTDRVGRAEAQPPGYPLSILRHLSLQIFEIVEESGGPGKKVFTGVGQVHSPTSHLDQADLQHALELMNLVAD